MCPPPSASPSTTIATIAADFRIISKLCTLLPARAPRQLMAVSASKTIAAMAPSLVVTPLISRKYFANVTATAAMPPVCVTSSSTQP